MFTLGVIPKCKKRRQESEYNREHEAQQPANPLDSIEWLAGTAQVLGSFCSLREKVEENKEVLSLRSLSKHDEEVYHEMQKVKDGDYSAFYEAKPPSEAPLLVKSLKSSRKPRKPYGQKGITTYGKRVVKNASLLLERKYGKGRLGFVTCSLPSFPEREHALLNGCWGEVVRRFYQKLKRQLEKVSQPFIYCGVTEIQEKRFKKHGIPAPHLHFVYLSRSNSRSRYWLYICQIHRAWNQAIQEGLVFAGSSFSMEDELAWGSVHAQRVKKSCAAYLGKYISKGCRVLESMIEKGWTEFPRQWWTACMQTKKMYKESLIKPNASMRSMLFYDAERLLELGLITYMRSVWIELGGTSYRVGLMGTLSKELYSFIKNTE